MAANDPDWQGWATTRLGSVVAERYRLDRLVGRGGMGVVYAGEHVQTGRPVAVKLLRAPLHETADAVRRFMQEARAAVDTRHPHVVDVLDAGRCGDGTPYVALELLHGETLAEYLTRRGPISLSETLLIVEPLLDALAACHARGIVHRDLKSNNAFLHLDTRGVLVPKLLDFGIAKRLDERHTSSGEVLGTVAYMAPEQAAGEQVLPAADVWAMGVVIYEMLTCRLPLAGTPSKMLAELLTHAAPRFDGLLDLPVPLTRVLNRAFARDPHARYADAGSFKQALLQAVQEASVPSANTLSFPVEPPAWTPGLTPELAVTLPAIESSVRMRQPPSRPAANAQARDGRPPLRPGATVLGAVLLLLVLVLGASLTFWMRERSASPRAAEVSEPTPVARDNAPREPAPGALVPPPAPAATQSADTAVVGEASAEQSPVSDLPKPPSSIPKARRPVTRERARVPAAKPDRRLGP